MLMPRKRYTKEFKAQAVDLVRHGKPVQEVEVGRNLIYKWIQKETQTSQLPRRIRNVELPRTETRVLASNIWQCIESVRIENRMIASGSSLSDVREAYGFRKNNRVAAALCCFLVLWSLARPACDE